MSITDDAAAQAPQNGDSAEEQDEHALLDLDQTAADTDQTGSDRDQTSSDVDQSLSDRDQRQANLDQDASDRDQAAADLEMSAHPDATQAAKDAYEAAREERAKGAKARTATGLAREGIATERIEQARHRDHEAEIRDLTAQARDLAADALDRAADERARQSDNAVDPRYQRLHRAAKEYEYVLGETAAQARKRAAADRAKAAEDRERAARDREQAARDREEAQIALERAHLDDLTGAYRRGIGRVVIQNEIERAEREDGRLVLGFVDVDGLKAVNDRSGHAAGDALLMSVARAIRSKMRSYEPLVRYGGDEFICALGGLELESAAKRFDEIRSELAAGDTRATISVGLAELEPCDGLDDLIERADQALVTARD